jgi:hypothetical protein
MQTTNPRLDNVLGGIRRRLQALRGFAVAGFSRRHARSHDSYLLCDIGLDSWVHLQEPPINQWRDSR